MTRKIRFLKNKIWLHSKLFFAYLRFLRQKLKYKRPPEFLKELWVRPKDLHYFMISGPWFRDLPVFRDYRLIKSRKGVSIINTDLWEHKIDAETVIKDSLKYQSVKSHFVDKVPWLESEIFIGESHRSYKNLFKTQKEVKECLSLEELAESYDKTYTKIFNDIKKNGFRSSKEDKSIDPMQVDIDKDGNLCYTSGGNHRLAMALILNLDIMPVQIRGMHRNWQLLRDELWTIGPEAFFKKYPNLKNHPDLEDCIRKPS